MPSLESIERKLSQIEGAGYFTQDDWVIASYNRRDGEPVGDAMRRRHPNKTDDPAIVEIFRKCQERTARAALIRAGELDEVD